MMISNNPAIWTILLLWALAHADQDTPTLFHDRIDGVLFPYCPEHLS